MNGIAVYLVIGIVIMLLSYVLTTIFFIFKILNRKSDPLLGGVQESSDGEVTYVEIEPIAKTLCIGYAFQGCMKGNLLETKWFVTWYIVVSAILWGISIGSIAYISTVN